MRDRHPSSISQQGFTLIELAIVLIIISFLIGSVLATGSSRTGFARIKQTQDKIGIIEEALAAYVTLNGRLPCPASGTQQRKDGGGNPDPLFGLSEAPPCAATLVAGQGIHYGVVPVRALNLADEFMFDGWGRRFTYAVDTDFITSQLFEITNVGSITINDNNGNTRTTQAVVTFISHGPTGFGAWPKNGGARQATGSLGAGENQNGPASVDATFVQAPQSATFDDYTSYFTKRRLLSEAGGILQNDTCELARRTLEPYKDICTLAAGEPRVGPTGCEIITCPQATPPELNTYCVVRQTEMANIISQKCYYR